MSSEFTESGISFYSMLSKNGENPVLDRTLKLQRVSSRIAFVTKSNPIIKFGTRSNKGLKGPWGNGRRLSLGNRQKAGLP